MKRRFLSLLLSVLLVLTACSYLPQENTSLTETQITKSENTAEFHFIDVGQGDCILIQGGGTNILIDAGTSESSSDICAYLRNLGIDYLDYFIGSHPHDDHLGGASMVLRTVDVGTVFLNGDSSSAYFFEDFVDTLIEKEITPVIPNMDCIYETGPFRIKFLSPTKDFGNTNDNSLVTLVEYGDIKALFTGDAERAVEAQLLKNGQNLGADILKIGHHGSRYASSAEFLNAVYPDVAVIQCGKDNSYGHPHEEVLQRLSLTNAAVLRTDESGSIIIRTDGKTVYNASGDVYEKPDESVKPDIIYIGNQKSEVFHSEACPNLPGEQNRTEFATREAAVESGYKPCGNCNP